MAEASGRSRRIAPALSDKVAPGDGFFPTVLDISDNARA